MFRLNGVLYFPAIAPGGLTLRKAAIGTTKTERGVTYRLNKNHRWEKVGHESPGQLSLLGADSSDNLIANMQSASYDEGEAGEDSEMQAVEDDTRSVADRRYSFEARPMADQVALVGDRGLTLKQVKPQKEIKLVSDVPDLDLYEDVEAEISYESGIGGKVVDDAEKLSFVVRVMQHWGQVAGGDALDVFRPDSVFIGKDGESYVSYGGRYFPLARVRVNSADQTAYPGVYIG